MEPQEQTQTVGESAIESLREEEKAQADLEEQDYLRRFFLGQLNLEEYRALSTAKKQTYRGNVRKRGIAGIPHIKGRPTTQHELNAFHKASTKRKKKRKAAKQSRKKNR